MWLLIEIKLEPSAFLHLLVFVEHDHLSAPLHPHMMLRQRSLVSSLSTRPTCQFVRATAVGIHITSITPRKATLGIMAPTYEWRVRWVYDTAHLIASAK